MTYPPLHNVENDSLIYNDTDKADLLNTYFCSISDLDDNYISPPSFATKTDERLTHITITCNDVLYVLQVLKLGKASGLDHISHHMLKYTASTVCKPLQKLFTFSLRLAVFPDNWKTALVLPLFKNGEKQLPANYRPIALLSTVGKVFERVVFKNMFNFFFSNN